ncbi:DUF308 domain-containing protein [Actinotalea sp.]|uniref:DUF308 domain-containing protein n=1 Tax=Actinotalea sp. TaxID=1872145 RepID=UPI003566883C
MTPDASALRSAATITWVPLLVVGVLVAATGGVVLASPDATVTLLTVLIALWMLVTGLGRATLGLAVSAWPAARRVPTVVTGALLAIAGVAALVNLSGSVVVLGWVIGIGLLIGAAGDAAVLLSGRAKRSRAGLVVLGVGQLALGIVFLLAPTAGLSGIAVALGVTLVAIGVVAVIGGLVVRSRIHGYLDRVMGPSGPGGASHVVIEGNVR